MKWKIKDIEIENQLVLAPMAGIGNSAYRRIIKENRCGLIYTEMVSDKAVVFGNQKTIDMLYMTEEERPITQQVFGADVESFVKAAKFIEETMKPDIIDINMGCPVPKVAIRAQAGAALMKDPKKVGEIVSAVVKAVSVPVTVKIRSGWDENSINAVPIAKIIEESGASAVCVHARTRKQAYSGKADWNIIKQVKENVSIPVIGNGDVTSGPLAKKMLEETGCDAVMIGRGALGNPWVMRECVHYLETGEELPKPTLEEKIDTCLKHIEYLSHLKSEYQAALEIRNHVGWYFKGEKGAAKIKNAIYQMTEIRDIIKLLSDYKKEL